MKKVPALKLLKEAAQLDTTNILSTHRGRVTCTPLYGSLAHRCTGHLHTVVRVTCTPLYGSLAHRCTGHLHTIVRVTCTPLYGSLAHRCTGHLHTVVRVTCTPLYGSLAHRCMGSLAHHCTGHLHTVVRVHVAVGGSSTVYSKLLDPSRGPCSSHPWICSKHSEANLL